MRALLTSFLLVIVALVRGATVTDLVQTAGIKIPTNAALVFTPISAPLWVEDILTTGDAQGTRVDKYGRISIDLAGGYYSLQVGTDTKRFTIGVPPGTGTYKLSQLVSNTIAFLTNIPPALYEVTTNKGQANGYASLGPDGLVPAEQLPEGLGGGGSGDVTTVQLNAASNSVRAAASAYILGVSNIAVAASNALRADLSGSIAYTLTVSNQAYLASNALRSDLIAAIAYTFAVSNISVTASNSLRTAYLAADIVVSNALVALLVANDTTTSNALRTAYITADAVVSNAVVAFVMTTSNTLYSAISGGGLNTNQVIILLSNGIPVLTAGLFNVGAMTLSNALGVASGGTGLTNLGMNTLVVGNGTNPPTLLQPGTDGQVLKIASSTLAWGTDNNSGGTATFQTTNLIVSTTNNLVWDAGNFPQAIAWGLTNLNRMIVSNLTGPAYLTWQQDSNGTREVNLTYWSGPLLTNANKSLRPGTNANIATTYKFLPYGTNSQAALWETNINAVPFTNSLASGGGGGGGGGIAFVSSTSARATAAADTITSAIDTSGATALFALAFKHAGNFPDDSRHNTWTEIGRCGAGAYAPSWWVCLSPSVGANHYFTNVLFGGGATGGSIIVYAFSGTTALDATNCIVTGNWGSGTLQVPSTSPAVANELALTGLGWDTAISLITIPSGYTGGIQLAQSYAGVGLDAAYKIKTGGDTTAEAPTWSQTGSGNPDGHASVLLIKP